MIDYLIVGSGLAGIAFADIALQNNKTIHVFENSSQNSSIIAGGLYNPVILKRFSEVWQAQAQLRLANDVYNRFENQFNIQIDFKIPILRKLFSVEEQNNWFTATDKVQLAPFLSPKLRYDNFKGIEAPFGYGEVLQSGYLDTQLLVKHYQFYLKSLNALFSTTFNYHELILKEEYVQYQGKQYKNVIFAEGFGLHLNPFFKQLPLDGTKGELIIIKCPNLNLDVIIKSSVFILPLGKDLYKVGATYNWEDKTALPTEEGKQELVTNLKSILNLDFEIVEHFAGVRPTVKDRRPLIGTHPKYSDLHVLNGLGTRGVMLAPAMAKALFEHIEFHTPLPKEIDIKRFKKVTWD